MGRLQRRRTALTLIRGAARRLPIDPDYVKCGEDAWARPLLSTLQVKLLNTGFGTLLIDYQRHRSKTAYEPAGRKLLCLGGFNANRRDSPARAVRTPRVT